LIKAALRAHDSIASPVRVDQEAEMPFFNEHSFEEFFANTADLKVDKLDLRRLEAFLTLNLSEFLIRGEDISVENKHPGIVRHDLPITKGFGDTIYDFRQLDQSKALRSAMEDAVATVVAEARLKQPLEEEARAYLPQIVGGLALALARIFKATDPSMRNPGPAEWAMAFTIADQTI
jgi:hypothetical protein